MIQPHRPGPDQPEEPGEGQGEPGRAAALIRGRPEYSILILPEGTRTLDGNLGPFKRGGFHLALETGLDILPLVQTGSYRVLRKGSLLVRPGKVELTVLPPIPIAGCSRDDVGELADRARSVFMATLGSPGSPGAS